MDNLGNLDNWVSWVMLYALYQEEGKKWDLLRNKEIELLKLIEKEYTDYFNNMFQSGVPDLTLQSDDKKFYRARQIKTEKFHEIGFDLGKYIDSYYRIFHSNEEIQQMDKINSSGNFVFTPEHLLLLKSFGNLHITEEQQKKLDELNEKYSKLKFYGFAEKGSGVPPAIFRKAGRMNTISDEYLYLAFDRDTAIYEMRPSIGQLYSIARFQINKNLKIADLTGQNLKNNEYIIPFMSLASNISEPNTESSDTFYHITQHMAHMLQEKGFDGIMYKSALKKDHNNLLLFDESNATIVSSEIVFINNVNVDYSIVPPFNTNNNKLR